MCHCVHHNGGQATEGEVGFFSAPIHMDVVSSSHGREGQPFIIGPLWILEEGQVTSSSFQHPASYSMKEQRLTELLGHKRTETHHVFQTEGNTKLLRIREGTFPQMGRSREKNGGEVTTQLNYNVSTVALCAIIFP